MTGVLVAAAMAMVAMVAVAMEEEEMEVAKEEVEEQGGALMVPVATLGMVTGEVLAIEVAVEVAIDPQQRLASRLAFARRAA